MTSLTFKSNLHQNKVYIQTLMIEIDY